MTDDKYYGYWKYYSSKYDWSAPPFSKHINKDHSIEAFKNFGLTEKIANQLWGSGYIYIKKHDIVIDRFYGGYLSSYDMATRFPISQIGELFDEAKSSVWIKSASSIEDVRRIADEAKSKSSKPIRFRGQRQNYFTNRAITNPYFTINGLGEISILSSFWRTAFANSKNTFIEFEAPSLLEWSNIFYTAYDLTEIERRHKIALDRGEYIYTMQDMADSEDPLLSEFGNHRLDLAMGINHNLADTLSTLLQHYGLLSTVIDLTSSLDVALFFATHKYTCNNNESNYEFIGTNNGKSVIYLIRGNDREMVSHHDDRILDKIPPERPKRQNCIISRSAPLAVNLPALFLEGIINLDFNLNEKDSPKTMRDLFPDESNDKFLQAIRKGASHPDKVTYFG